jgi:hypothetical protein
MAACMDDWLRPSCKASARYHARSDAADCNEPIVLRNCVPKSRTQCTMSGHLLVRRQGNVRIQNCCKGKAMISLTDAARPWHDWYMLIGTASATLVGLMFVAASVGSRLYTRKNIRLCGYSFRRAWSISRQF